MKRVEAEHIAEYGHAFGMTMTREYGGLYVPGEHTPRAEQAHENISRSLRRGRLPGMSQETSLIKPQDPHNLNVLTSSDAVGRAFGVMTKQSFQSGQRLVHTGVITDRTRQGELHILPLLESATPLDQFSGIDALSRIMVKIGGLMQQAGVGTAEADKLHSTPGELGHAMQGISALTDAATLQAIRGKRHVAHDWNTDGVNSHGQIVPAPGPAVALSARANKTSLFALHTDQGIMQNGFLPELVITDSIQGYMLVDHVSLSHETESARLVPPEELAVGMGMVAASSHLEQGGATLQERAMGIMRAI